MSILIRLILRNRWGMIIVGAILAVVGLGYGITSQQVNYQNQQTGAHYNVILSTLGNVYLHEDGSPDWFVLQQENVNPPLDVSSLPNGFTLDFVARTDTIDVSANLGQYGSTTSAHVIEHLAFQGPNGTPIVTYNTPEYAANPNGVYINNWPAGLGITGAGLLLIVLSLVFYRSKKPQAFSIAPTGGVEPPMYGQPMGNPYPQPNANPYGQGANPYGQPNANPYGQPYQGQPPANPYPPYQQPPQQ